MGHSAERTNPKGQPFVGRCFACGKEGLTSEQVMKEECPNTRGLSEDDALIEAIEGPMTEPKPNCKVMQDHLRERFNLGDEPLFILRGQDMIAPSVVRYWAQMYREVARPGEWNDDKHKEALGIAVRMDNWKTHKIPD